jgi:hypothetical protein
MRATSIAVIVIVLLIIGIAAYALTRDSRMNDQAATTRLSQPIPNTSMQLTSPAFANEASIPAAHTCDVQNPPSPSLEFLDVPENAVSLALIMDDPDVPTQVRPEGVFDHWVLFDIPPETAGIPEGGSVGTKGANGRGTPSYAGPFPPPNFEPAEHRYFFRLYALDTMLGLPEGATKQQVLDAMEGHVLAEAKLMGRYKRESK